MVKGSLIYYVILVSNSVAATSSVALIIFGIWLNVNSASFPPINIIASISTISITIGSFVTATSGLGCFGAISSKKWGLLFISTNLILLACGLAVVMVGTVYQNKLQTVIMAIFEFESQQLPDHDHSHAAVMEYMNKNYDCCGIESRPFCHADYPGNCSMGSAKCQFGCFPVMWDAVVYPNLSIATALSSIMCFFMSVATLSMGVKLISNKVYENPSKYSYSQRSA